MYRHLLTAIAVGTVVCQAAQTKAKRKMLKPEREGATPHVYKTVGERRLRLFVMTPPGHEAEDKRPAMVFYHGGGWVGGAPGQFTEHSKYLIARGMVTVQVEYRLLARKSSDPPGVCIADAKSAMRWVRANATRLGIDPGRIAAGGGSAGGHLAAAVALLEGLDEASDDLGVSPRPNALVLFNPVYNNGPPPEGWCNNRVGDSYKQYSPAHNILPGAPPALVFLGTKDKLIPVATAEEFRDDMRAAGSRSELMLFEGEGHGFFNYGRGGGKAYRKTVRAMDVFLTSLGYLTGEPAMPPEP